MMKRKKYIIALLFITTFFVFVFYFKSQKTPSKVSVYPTLYTKKVSTKAIIDSNPKISKKITENKSYFLANVKSSDIPDKKDGEINNTTLNNKNLENGSWLWTPIDLLTAKYTEEVLTGANLNKINKIYLAIDSYLDIYEMADGQEKTKKLETFNKKIEYFLEESKKYNIQVDAVSGWKNWAKPEHTYKPFVIMDYVIGFNKNHNVKFNGIQYDIEPYLLDDYKENKKGVLKDFLVLMNDIFETMPKNEIEISVVIPEFFDKDSGETPKFFYNGDYDFTIDHLLKIMKKRQNSKIVIMAYRNFTTGYDGIFDISKEEVEKAEKSNVKIIIAQETGDFDPPYITYNNTSKEYYTKKIKEIRDFYKQNKSFSGIATHYINSFLKMR